MSELSRIEARLRRRFVFARDAGTRPPYMKYIALKSALNVVREVLGKRQRTPPMPERTGVKCEERKGGGPER